MKKNTAPFQTTRSIISVGGGIGDLIGEILDLFDF